MFVVKALIAAANDSELHIHTIGMDKYKSAEMNFRVGVCILYIELLCVHILF